MRMEFTTKDMIKSHANSPDNFRDCHKKLKNLIR
jgi:hypothetical protein